MPRLIAKYRHWLGVGVLVGAVGCARGSARSPPQPGPAAPTATSTSPTAGPDNADLAATAPPSDSGGVGSDRPANACEQDCQRGRMAEAVAWDMIVHDCRTTCANAVEEPPAAP